MKHARSDYDPIQDPREDGIPDDEPVFLVRAQDKYAPGILLTWAEWYEEDGGDPEVAEGVRKHADDMMEWQAEHGHKIPDVPEGAMR